MGQSRILQTNPPLKRAARSIHHPKSGNNLDIQKIQVANGRIICKTSRYKKLSDSLLEVRQVNAGRNCSNMGRPRQFRIEDVLECAIECFSAMGYEATSIQDLMEVTGIQKGSLYSTFGGKEDLFIECLRYSWDQEKTYIEKELARSGDLVEFSVNLASQSCFEVKSESLPSPADRRNFYRLMFHSIAAGSVLMPGAHEMVEEVFQFFSEKIAEAQRSGHVRGDLSASGISRILLCHIVGGGLMCSRFGGVERDPEMARLMCREMLAFR